MWSSCRWSARSLKIKVEEINFRGNPNSTSPPHINPPSERKRVLIVEDHTGSRIALAGLLERRGYEVVSAASRTAPLQCAAAGHFDLLISDIGLPDGNGCRGRKIPAL